MNAKKSKISVLIVDDESVARRTIKNLIVSDPEMEVIGECSSGLEAVNFIRKRPPDLLFLDIQMPGLNGFETLSRVDVGRIPAIVFVTAFDQYALKAFEVHALDYLLKPFSDQRFEETLRQAKTHIQMSEVSRLTQSLVALIGEQAVPSGTVSVKRKRFLTRFMIRAGGRAAFIKADDVDWIGADDYYIKLHIGGKAQLLRMSMNELEEKLDPKRFLRIHRSIIVNFDRVKELHQNPNGEYMVILKDGTELKLSRTGRERLDEFLMPGEEE